MTARLIENITEFSDDILLNIFSNLNSWDLLSVLETCDRFNKVGKDHSLWKVADFKEGFLTASQIIRRVMCCLGMSTLYIHLRGHKRKHSNRYRWKADLVTASILKNIGKKCPGLQELHLSEAVVNAKKLKLEHFQETQSIRTLCLRDCEFVCLPSPATDGSYFKNMPLYLPLLDNLEVSYSNWITDFDLMVLSKLDNLKKLVLKCDLRIGFTTAYLAISFRFGFKSLEELDLRGTSIQNSDIQSVVQSGKLKTLKLGPIGKVKRLTNDLDKGLGLVIPNPQRREEARQQIVVINMNQNGPRWRHANDDDLEEMGLQWVKKELDKCKQTAESELEPFFFGKEGKIEGGAGESSSKNGEEEEYESTNQSSKRKASYQSDDESFQATKKFCSDEQTSCSEDESSDEKPQLSTEETNLPDVGLSDLMVAPFKYHAKNMNTLLLNGCAISDSGLLELVKHLPVLRYIDTSNTHVTQAGIEQAQVLLPKCQFDNDIPVENR